MPWTFNPFTGTFDAVGTGGGGGGGTCANSPQLLCLGGRAGTANNPLIRTDGTGVITGSHTTGEGLTLVPNDVDTTGKLGMILPGQGWFTLNALGNPSLVVGGPGTYDITQDFVGVPIGDIIIHRTTAQGGLGATLAIWDDTTTPHLIFGSLGDGQEGLQIISVCGHGNSLATHTPATPNQIAFQFTGGAFADAGNLDLAMGGFGFRIFDVPSGQSYVPTDLNFLVRRRDSIAEELFNVLCDGCIFLGGEAMRNARRLDESALNIVPVDDRTTVVIQGVASQTHDLTEWRLAITGATTGSGGGANLPGASVLTLVDSTPFTASGEIIVARFADMSGVPHGSTPLAYTANNTGTGELTLTVPLGLPVGIPDGTPVYQARPLSHVDATGAAFFPNVATIVDRTVLTTQTADIGDTTLVTTAGTYRVSAYLQTTTADATAGAITLHIKYTDTSGTAEDDLVGPVVLTTIARAQAALVADLASGALTYGITSTGLYGTADYALTIVAEQLTPAVA